MQIRSVLALGVFNPRRKPNTAMDSMRELARKSDHILVNQAWIQWGPLRDGPWDSFTWCKSVREDHYHGYLNEVIRKFGMRVLDYDYFVTVQDDAVLPERYIERMIAIMEEYGFDVAQGTRSLELSYIAHSVSKRVPGLRARQVLFVEEGPSVIYNRKAAEVALTIEIGGGIRFFQEWPRWGYDIQFAYRAKETGLRLAYIDEIQVEHIRPYQGQLGRSNELRKELFRAVDEGKIKVLPKNQWQTVVEEYPYV